MLFEQMKPKWRCPAILLGAMFGKNQIQCEHKHLILDVNHIRVGIMIWACFCSLRIWHLVVIE